MSENERENEGISDDKLPEDLQPKEDNPLAEPLDDDVDVDDLDVKGGKTPEESGDEEDTSDSEDDADNGDDEQD